MKSDLSDLIGLPLDLALKAAAERGRHPGVDETRSPSLRADVGKRSPRVIAVRGDNFLTALFLDGGPEENHAG